MAARSAHTCWATGGQSASPSRSTACRPSCCCWWLSAPRASPTRRRIGRRGAHFHALFQFQLAGLNGAFLTADLFNLFVFFEVLLIASYGLLLHAPHPRRTRGGLPLRGGEPRRVGALPRGRGRPVWRGRPAQPRGPRGAHRAAPREEAVARAAAGVLLAVFLLKAAALPLAFWLPGTYGAAVPPVAALFAIMTKAGIYAIVRVFATAFGPHAGGAALMAEPWALSLGLATLAAGAMGALAAREFAAMAAWPAIASAGKRSRGLRPGQHGGPRRRAPRPRPRHARRGGALPAHRGRGRAPGPLGGGALRARGRRGGGPTPAGGLRRQGAAPRGGGGGSPRVLAVLLATSFVTMVALARMASRLFWKDESARASRRAAAQGWPPWRAWPPRSSPSRWPPDPCSGTPPPPRRRCGEPGPTSSACWANGPCRPNGGCDEALAARPPAEPRALPALADAGGERLAREPPPRRGIRGGHPARDPGALSRPGRSASAARCSWPGSPSSSCGTSSSPTSRSRCASWAPKAPSTRASCGCRWTSATRPALRRSRASSP